MNVKSDFLQTLVTYVNKDVTAQPQLLTCLTVIIKKLGLKTEAIDIQRIHAIADINQFSDSLGILVSAVNKPELNTLSSTYFPLLIQDAAGNYYVFLKKKYGKNYVFDADKNQQVILKNTDLLAKMHLVWQCCPVCSDLIINLTKLINYLFNNFSKYLVVVMTAGLVFSFLTGLITALISYFIADIGLINQSHIAGNYLPLLLFFLAVALLTYLNGLLQNSLTTRLTVYALPAIWQQLLKLPTLALQQYSAGDLTQRLADYELALTAIVPVLLGMVFSVFSLIIVFSYMAYLNILLSCGSLLIALIFLSIKLLIIPLNVKHLAAEFKAQGRAAGFLNEVLLQIHKIRAACAEAMVFKKWLSYWVELKSQAEYVMELKMWLLLLEIAMPLVLILVFYYLIYMVPNHQSFFWLQFIVCANQFGNIFDKFSNHILNLLHYLPTLQRIETLFPVTSLPEVRKISITNINGDIAFSQVSYIDTNSGRVILNDINLTIQAGEFIGIIGESGAGKSTLFKLLLGLTNISAGRISLDNVNIAHIDSQALRKQFGVVLQNSNIFPGSIFANLAINKTLTLAQAWQLAENVGLADDIQRMPMQMHTYISDNAGESISGGQKQKILLARALATNPRVLLLDEATSALDSTSQAHIYRYLKTLNITRIVIAHRQNTLVGADRIYLLNKGTLHSH
ncbi:MAG: ATP-binding cassette domain-containing protein [Pseudomonadota bacterium]